ncbi:MAG: RagB/SusD family nutrient uptake outer membrane protein [Rikenellaceae bacterium]
MKKLYILIPITFLASCESYFDHSPKTEINPEAVYSSYDGALKNLGELYARLGSVNSGINGSARFKMPSLIRPGEDAFKLHSMSSIPETLWDNYYSYIGQANLVIMNINEYAGSLDDSYESSAIDNATLVGSASNQLLAEARFLRAYAYFNLYRYFGGVPLILEDLGPSPEYTPRATRQEMFDFLYEEMYFALENIADNDSGISYGRVTKGAVAAFIAKAQVFHASYIRRASMYGTSINESTDDSYTIDELYASAMTLCDDIIAGEYGSYALEPFYPAVFTKNNSEVILSALAEEGNGTGNEIPMGFPGTSSHGANNGQTLTSSLTLLYDIPMWDHDYRFKNLSRYYGKTDRFNLEDPEPGTTTDDLSNLFASMGEYTLTGDTTRRMWTSVKGWVTGPDDGGTEYGLWVFEPAGRYLGEEFYIEPGLQEANYTAAQIQVMEKALESHERTWWKDYDIDESILWNVNLWCLGKFRNLNPSDLSSTFSIDQSGVDYPLMRLAEIYLLKAEIYIMQNQTTSGIATLNIIRDRACNQSTTRDLFLYQGDAPYSYEANSVEPIPMTLSNDFALKEMLYERLRELAGEDDCGWLDLSRYPDIMMEDLEDICRYPDALRGATFFADATNNEYLWDMFNDEKIYKVLLPIPNTEFSYFPLMEQNPGY